MNYNEFKERVEKVFKDKNSLPDELKTCEISFETIYNTGRKLNSDKPADSMIFIHPDKELCPNVYIENLYDNYRKSNDFDDVISDTFEIVINAFKDAESFDMSQIYDKNKIVFQLINTDKNKHILDSIPHRSFHDLSIIYKVVVNIDNDGINSILVNEALMSMLDVNEEELFELAKKNTKELFPPKVCKLQDELKRALAVEFDLSDDALEDYFVDSDDNDSMWLISNNCCSKGACTILYPDVLHSLAESIDSDLYILPSSVHEVIAVPILNNCDVDDLRKTVNLVNTNDVAEDEYLSDSVYVYSRVTGEISLAADSGLGLGSYLS